MSDKKEEIKIDPETKKKLEQHALDMVARWESVDFSFSRLPNWLTNISLGLLGFFVALLLQMKSVGYDFNIYVSMIFFALILTSIIIGFVLRVKQEQNEYMKKIVSLMRDVNSLMRELSEVIEEFDWEKEGMSLSEDIKSFKKSKPERKRETRKWFNGVKWQIFCFWFSFLIMVRFLVGYLYNSSLN